MAQKRGSVELIITSNPDKEGLLVSKPIMDEFSQTETTFDTLAVCNKTNNLIKSNKILVLDDVQNPDNVGAFN